MKELLEAGVHFGHQVRRWNPKMKEYIFGERNGIYIIDLQKTQRMFKEAIKFVTNMSGEGTNKTILFVGTKRQAQDAIKEEAVRCNQFYVNQRWLGDSSPISRPFKSPSSGLKISRRCRPTAASKPTRRKSGFRSNASARRWRKPGRHQGDEEAS